MSIKTTKKVQYKVKPFIEDWGDIRYCMFGTKIFSELTDALFYQQHLFTTKDKMAHLYEITTETSDYLEIVVNKYTKLISPRTKTYIEIKKTKRK